MFINLPPPEWMPSRRAWRPSIQIIALALALLTACAPQAQQAAPPPTRVTAAPATAAPVTTTSNPTAGPQKTELVITAAVSTGNAPPVLDTPVAPADPLQPAKSPVPPVTTPPVVSSLDEWLTAIANAGASVERGQSVQDSFFSAPGTFYRINGEEIQVFAFASEAERRQAAGMIQANGYIIGQAAVDWMSQPYFFANGPLIALYVGKDQPTLALLARTLGDPLTQ